MAPGPAPGEGRDDGPVPGVPVPEGAPPGGAGVVTPDWLDDADWQQSCAARADEECPADEVAEWFPDPDCGPPPGLAGVPFGVLAAQVDADGAADAAVTARMIGRGVCREGYAHRPGAGRVIGAGGGPAASFAQGAPVGTWPPGPLLGGRAGEACGPGRAFGGVNDDELMGLTGARQRLECRAARELLAAAAEFARRRPQPGCGLTLPGRMPEACTEHAAAGLAVQLRLSRQAAGDVLWLAHALAARLPRASAALRDGVIDLAKARIIAVACSLLTPAEARAAEAILFGDPGAGEMTWGMIRDRIARAVITVNAAAAAGRREDAAKTRRVEVLPEGSGNAMIAGRELPPAAVLAASENLTIRARELRAAGCPAAWTSCASWPTRKSPARWTPWTAPPPRPRTAQAARAAEIPGRIAAPADRRTVTVTGRIAVTVTGRTAVTVTGRTAVTVTGRTAVTVTGRTAAAGGLAPAAARCRGRCRRGSRPG